MFTNLFYHVLSRFQVSTHLLSPGLEKSPLRRVNYSMQLKGLLRTRRYPSLGQSQTKRKPVCRRQDAHLLTDMVAAEVFD